MADKRISELTAVVAPLGTDEFPCNQAGVTKKETRTQITATVTANLASHMAAIPATHANKSILYALLQDMPQYSVLGRAGAGTGVPGAIVPPLWNTVLAATAGSTQFTSVTNAMMAAETLTVGSMANGTEVVTIPYIVYNLTDDVMTYTLPDNHDCRAYGHLRVPADYVSGGTVTWLGYSAGAGNVYRAMNVYGGAVGEAYNTHSTLTGAGVVAIGGGAVWETIASSNISAWLAVGDNIRVEMVRDAADPLDTVGSSVHPMAYFTYTANHGG
jgi:hypothetical protein